METIFADLDEDSMRYSVMLCNQGKYVFKNGAENFNIIRIHQKVYYFIYLSGNHHIHQLQLF